MKRWHGIAIGLVAYLLFLVINAPAARVLPLLQPLLPAVQLRNVDGTVWSGSSAWALAGPVQLQAVRWKFRPFALLTGKTEIALNGQLQGRTLQARIGKHWFGGPYLRDLQGLVPVQELLTWMQVGQVGAQGNLELSLDEVRWSDARIPAIAGLMTWLPARVVTPMEIDFGKAQLESRLGEGGMSLGKLTTSGSALLVAADVQLNPDGAYRMDAEIRQDGEVPSAVANFLSTFAEYRNGSYHFEWSNSL